MLNIIKFYFLTKKVLSYNFDNNYNKNHFFRHVNTVEPLWQKKTPLAPINKTSKVTGSSRNSRYRHMFQSTSFREFIKFANVAATTMPGRNGRRQAGESVLAWQKWFGRWCHQHQHQNLDRAIVKINDVLPLNSWAGNQGTCVTEWLPKQKKNIKENGNPGGLFISVCNF